MARLMNALQLALGSVGSGIQGYGQARAAREEQERQAKLFKEQQDMNAENRQFQIAGLMERGFQRGGAGAAGAAGAASLVGPALNAVAEKAGMLSPLAGAGGMGGTGGAGRVVTIGGETFTLSETQSERSERLADALRVDTAKNATAEIARVEAAKEAERKRVKQQYLDAGYSPRDATLAAENATLFTTVRGQNMSDARAALGQGLTGRSVKTAEDRLAFDQTAATEKKAEAAAKLAASKQAANSVLPTVIKASEAVSKWGEKEVKSLDPARIAAQNAAVLEGGLWGVVMSKVLSKTGISDLDKQYLQYASAVADAVARASEVGVLTNQDINRFRSQVLFDGGENEEQIRFKLANLQDWAKWLASSKKLITNANGSSTVLSSNYGSGGRLPGETLAEYASRMGGE